MASDATEFAVVGTGFWAGHQINAWKEIPEAQCIAAVDPDLEKAREFAARHGIERVFPSVEALFEGVRPRFVDVISSPASHETVVKQAAKGGADVICQKPLAMETSTAKGMVTACESTGVSLSVHENWRWQRPIRAFADALHQADLGRIFRATMAYDNSFPVFDNQPTLKQEKHFILSDMGTHLFDVLRYLFGEPIRLSCEVERSREDIRGEDVASVLAKMDGGRLGHALTVYCSISYASKLESDRFPETRLVVEGQRGSVALCDDYWVSVTTQDGTIRTRHPPLFYPWVDSRYGVVHSSMVDCCRHLLDSIASGTPAETSGRDNLKTLAMVDAAYEAEENRRVVELSADSMPQK